MDRFQDGNARHTAARWCPQRPIPRPRPRPGPGPEHGHGHGRAPTLPRRPAAMQPAYALLSQTSLHLQAAAAAAAAAKLSQSIRAGRACTARQPAVTISRLTPASPARLPVPRHGHVMVTSWSRHGHVVVTSWSRHGHVMVMRWPWHHGTIAPRTNPPHITPRVGGGWRAKATKACVLVGGTCR
jgi:hypothetical protein